MTYEAYVVSRTSTRPQVDSVPERPVNLDGDGQVVGRDGKLYPRQKPHKRKPSNEFVNRFCRALSQLINAALTLDNLTNKNGFAEHLNELCREHCESVEWAQQIIDRVLAQMLTNGELLPAAPHPNGEGPA